MGGELRIRNEDLGMRNVGGLYLRPKDGLGTWENPHLAVAMLCAKSSPLLRKGETPLALRGSAEREMGSDEPVARMITRDRWGEL